MIEFITLFLGGLFIGVRPVEIMVGEAVTTVEVRLDGDLQQRLESPPWVLSVDFGAELAPHFLEAIAIDKEKNEIGRARQWINMSPEPAQSSLIIEGVAEGKGAIARVSWETVAETGEPRSFEVEFDGEPLSVDDPRAIQLPEFDPRNPHHLRVRLDFGGWLFSESEAVFGGGYGSEVSSEISAVPIWFDKGRKPRSAPAMDSWFTVEGVPQRVHAIEKGLAEIIVVRHVSAASSIAELEDRARFLGSEVRIKKHHRISFISPCPRLQSRNGVQQQVYWHSQTQSSRTGALTRLLNWIDPVACTEQSQKIADAVGAAGLTASSKGSRRLVLLLIHGEPQDQSDFKPAEITAYLEKLRVPLVVWNLGPADGRLTAWGEATEVHRFRHLDAAFNKIEANLERQLIVWLEGLHLPQSVELAPGVEGIALVE